MVTTPPSSTQPGRSAYVYLISTAAAISGLLFGFQIAIINAALLSLRREFALTDFQTEIAASSLLIGCVAGTAGVGVLSDRFGRRRIFILSAWLFALSALGAALPRGLWEFTAARFVGGTAIGFASVLAPLFIAEVAPARIRGRLVSMNQMAIVTGMLLAYLAGWLLSLVGPEAWRWMFGSALVPAVAFLGALYFLPESPRWLIQRGRTGEALAVISRVAGREQALVEVSHIQRAVAEESGSIRQLFQPGLRRPLWIAVFLAVLQQITGMNTVFFYGSVIFKELMGSQSETAAVGANVIIGGVNFLATLVALWVIDRLGRRPLLMLSAAGMALGQGLIGLAFLFEPPPAALLVAAILFCVACFAVGLGPGVWLLLSELFPTRIRGRAMSIATLSLWVACVALTLTFLSLVKAVTASGAFWIYSTLCLITLVFVWRAVPETKGRTLEDIERSWTR